MAYEARSHFPEKKIHITNEIIHNPQVKSFPYICRNGILSNAIWKVNERLVEMDMKFIKGVDGKKDFNKVEKGDVVILPAFGATIQEMQLLDEKW